MRKGERWRLIGLVLLFAALVTYMFRLAGEAYDRRFTPLPYSYGQHQYGAKGLARLLERNGYTVRSLKRTFVHLPDDADMLIIFPLPASVEGFSLTQFWTEEDAEYLDGWVQEGGVLVLMANDSRLPEAFRTDRGRPPFATPERRFMNATPLWNPDWMAGIRSVRMGDFGRLQPNPDYPWVPLLGDAGGATVALMRYGNGYVLECADWLWLTNGRLREADNAAFFLAFVKQVLPKGGVIYFDDAGLGDIILDEESAPRGFWGYAPPALRVAFAHLVVLTAIVMLSLGRRFGLPLPERPRHPPLGEYVDALANLYASAQAVQPAFATILEDIRRRLCRQLGLPSGATLLQLIQSLPPETPLREALTEAHRALQNPTLTEGEAIRILRRIAEAQHSQRPD